MMLVETLLEAKRVAFALQDVDRIVRAVAVHAVPGAPGCLLGAIDVAGELLSVYDTRRLLGLPSRPLAATDRIILIRAPVRCGLVVDEVLRTIEVDAPEPADRLAMQAAGVRGVARTADGLLLVQDLRRLLALERAIPIASHA
jgi:purine-binding chemotaxis protein CheW